MTVTPHCHGSVHPSERLQQACCWHGFRIMTWAKKTCLEAGVEPPVTVSGCDNGGKLFPRSRVVQASILQVVCHALETLWRVRISGDFQPADHCNPVHVLDR